MEMAVLVRFWVLTKTQNYGKGGIRMPTDTPTLPPDERNLEQAVAELRPRRKVLLGALLAGNTVAESSRIAKYSAPRAGSEALADMRKKLPALMDMLGLSTTDLLRKVKQKTEATKVITANWNGEITDAIEVEDHGTQMDAVKLSLRLRGLLTNDSDGPSHLTIAFSNVSVTNNEHET
jgi:hypothetical protein